MNLPTKDRSRTPALTNTFDPKDEGTDLAVCGDTSYANSREVQGWVSDACVRLGIRRMRRIQFTDRLYKKAGTLIDSNCSAVNLYAFLFIELLVRNLDLN